MSSRSSSRAARNGSIDKLDFDSNRKPPAASNDSTHSAHSGLLASDESFFSRVVERAVSLDRRKMASKVARYASFASAIVNCLCAGSITAYSLYGPLFLRHLRYTQYQVNAVSTTAELAMYLPVPLFGWLCDRYSPGPLSAVSAVLFGAGYLLAALTYRAGPILRTREHGEMDKVGGWPFAVMVIAFVGIGAGTSCMYLSAVTTCAKNFGRGKYKGLALSLPIAAFGLSGMWQSQVGSHFFKAEGNSEDTDVFRYFLFLAGLLFAVGLIGALLLRVVNEEELVDDAVSDLERSGLLEEERSPLFHHSHHHHDPETNPQPRDYGTTNGPRSPSPTSPTTSSSSPTPSLKKRLLLKSSTRLFLTDPTMWLLTLGFFLTTGPGETYINNLGTILPALLPPGTTPPPSNSPATHVSIVALTSTLARLLTGILSDLFAPSPPSHHHHQNPHNQNHHNHHHQPPPDKPPHCPLSRLTLLLTSTLLFATGQLLLATPTTQHHPPIFPLVSALIGTGYGAIFSLTPLIVSIVWGVENFGTNWGIVAVVPAGGAALWGGVYSWGYERGIGGGGGNDGGGGGSCFGWECYGGAFGGMVGASVLALGVWGVAWGRWRARGVLV